MGDLLNKLLHKTGNPGRYEIPNDTTHSAPYPPTVVYTKINLLSSLTSFQKYGIIN